MRIAIVTGASSGLGKEFVYQLTSKFKSLDEIWVIARRSNLLEQLRNEFKHIIKIRVISADLSTDESIKEFSNTLAEIKPQVRVLINCAGFGIIGDFSQLKYEDNIGMVDTNCRGLVAVTYATLPYMCKNSNLINIASAAAFLPQPHFAIYAATKSFVLSFSRGLRSELLSKKIFVTAVCPGPVNTEFFDKAEIYSQVKIYKKIVRAKCNKVVKKALWDAYKKKAISVYGIPMNAMRIICKILPHGICIKFL